MEKDTVLLSLEKYNELIDFKKEVEENLKLSKFAVIEETNGFISSGYTRKYYTECEIVLDFEKRNKELENRNKELENRNKELSAENKELKSKNWDKTRINDQLEKEINDLKKMSYWEFRKWRKS